MLNQLHINKDFGWFTGYFDNNQKHKHYAIQLSIPLEKSISIKTGKGTITSELPILIQSNIVHRFNSKTKHFLLLINPASTIGHFWKTSAMHEIQEFNSSPALDLKNILTDTTLKQEERTNRINQIIFSYDCFCRSSIHHGDPRVNKALAYLKENYDSIVPLEEIAGYCHLSPGRFLHFFKEQTGITYRRAQLWIKIVQALSMIGKMSFTQIAHSVGFADSAHFSRTFKENFGFGPREFSRISQFVQV